MTLAVEETQWANLRPHPKNPRNGDIDAIAESIRANGIYRPIITANDGTILAGHHLWYAIGEVHGQRCTVPVIRLDIDPRSPQALRVLIADNRTNQLGTTDSGLLIELLHTLDGDLLGTGFDAEGFQRLLEDASMPFVPAAPPPDTLHLAHSVVIACSSAHEAAETCETLLREGYDARVSTT